MGKKDKFLLLGIVLFLIGAILFLLWELRVISIPSLEFEEADVGNKVGSIYRKERDLKRRKGNSLSWFQVSEGETVREKDVLLTEENSTAWIKLDSGGELILSPNSLVSFSQKELPSGELALNVQLVRGKLKIKNSSRPIQLTTNEKQVKVLPDSELVVNFSPLEEKAELTVLSGNVEPLDEQKIDESSLTITASTEEREEESPEVLAGEPEEIGTAPIEVPTEEPKESHVPKEEERESREEVIEGNRSEASIVTAENKEELRAIGFKLFGGLLPNYQSQKISGTDYSVVVTGIRANQIYFGLDVLFGSTDLEVSVGYAKNEMQSQQGELAGIQPNFIFENKYLEAKLHFLRGLQGSWYLGFAAEQRPEFFREAAERVSLIPKSRYSLAIGLREPAFQWGEGRVDWELGSRLSGLGGVLGMSLIPAVFYSRSVFGSNLKTDIFIQGKIEYLKFSDSSTSNLGAGIGLGLGLSYLSDSPDRSSKNN